MEKIVESMKHSHYTVMNPFFNPPAQQIAYYNFTEYANWLQLILD